MSTERLTSDALAQYIGGHITDAETELDEAEHNADLTAEGRGVSALVSCAHSLLAVAACLFEVWQDDVQPTRAVETVELPGEPT